MKIILTIAIFLSGTTFWWTSSFMTGQPDAPRHWTWSLTNVFVILSILGCTVTAWAVLQSHGWWAGAVIISGVIGVLAVGAFVLAQRTLHTGLTDVGVQINLWLHLIGAFVLIAAAQLPALRSWIAELP